MAVLNRIAVNHWWPRLQFAWQSSPLRQPWLLVLLAMTLVLVGMLAQAWWAQQHWQQALRRQAAEPGSQAPVAALRAANTAQALPQSLQAQPSQAQPNQAWDQWPREEEADHISAEILALADAMGMVFERAEFQSGTSAQSALYVQRIKLPLRGDYVQLRHFLTLVLQRYPSLALAQCKLQRTDVQQPGLDAYVEFNLYTRKRRPS